jgi:hypothetical protein
MIPLENLSKRLYIPKTKAPEDPETPMTSLIMLIPVLRHIAYPNPEIASKK